MFRYIRNAAIIYLLLVSVNTLVRDGRRLARHNKPFEYTTKKFTY